MDPDSGDENDMDDAELCEDQPKDYWEEQNLARQITKFDPHGENEEEAKDNQLQVCV